jgi:hypothetical protein
MQRSINPRFWLFGSTLALPTLLVLAGTAWANVPVFINSWGSYGVSNGQFDRPVGIAVAPSGGN